MATDGDQNKTTGCGGGLHMKLFKPPEFGTDLSRMFPNTNDFLN